MVLILLSLTVVLACIEGFFQLAIKMPVRQIDLQRVVFHSLDLLLSCSAFSTYIQAGLGFRKCKIVFIDSLISQCLLSFCLGSSLQMDSSVLFFDTIDSCLMLSCSFFFFFCF